jgi:hypothetical protein
MAAILVLLVIKKKVRFGYPSMALLAHKVHKISPNRKAIICILCFKIRQKWKLHLSVCRRYVMRLVSDLFNSYLYNLDLSVSKGCGMKLHSFINFLLVI